MDLPSAEREEQRNQSSGYTRKDCLFCAATVPEQSDTERKERGSERKGVSEAIAYEGRGRYQQEDRSECDRRAAKTR